MADPFSTYKAGLTAPAYRHFAITPSDTVDLAIRPRAIVCIADGDVVVRDDTGADITYPMVAGDRLDFRAVRILATGTTATVVGWY